MERMWKFVGILFLVSILPGLFWITMNKGETVLQEVEVEQRFCTESPCSELIRQQVIETIIQNSDYKSERQVRWCLGVDSWADTKVRKGGWLIGPMMSVGYWFCPDTKE